MSGGRDEIGFLGLIGLGSLFFWEGFRALVLHKQLSGLATSRARSMAMGLVELSGIARLAESPPIDPLYEQPCCYYQLTVEQYRQTGKHGYWDTIYQENSDGHGFYCRDLTGQVLVLPKAPDVHFDTRLVHKNGLFGTDNVAAAAFLNARWSEGRSLRLTFDVLRDGDPVYVTGCALMGHPTKGGLVPSGSVTLTEAARELKRDATGMKDVDANKDGHIDPHEWDVGLQRYREFLEVKQTQAARPATSSTLVRFEGIVTGTPEHGLILANTEEDLLAKLAPTAYLQIVGGGAALVAGIVLLIMKGR